MHQCVFDAIFIIWSPAVYTDLVLVKLIIFNNEIMFVVILRISFTMNVLSYLK